MIKRETGRERKTVWMDWSYKSTWCEICAHTKMFTFCGPMRKFDFTNNTLIWSIDLMSSHKSSDIAIIITKNHPSGGQWSIIKFSDNFVDIDFIFRSVFFRISISFHSIQFCCSSDSSALAIRFSFMFFVQATEHVWCDWVWCVCVRASVCKSQCESAASV